jgi:tRNA1Val (adenine37-N6)-methyltransferase
VVQSKRGYRFSTDALLLAGFVTLKKGEQVIDLGTGVGIIPLILCRRYRELQRIIGIEIQEELVDLARRNVQLNGLEDRITILEGDIRQPDTVVRNPGADVVVSNPPYYRVVDGRINPEHQKALARHEVACTVNEVIGSARWFLRDGGRFFVIFPAFRSVWLFDRLVREQLEPKRVRWVYTRDDEAAKFILVEAHKKRASGVEILPPLIMYTDEGNYCPELRRLYDEGSLATTGGYE